MLTAEEAYEKSVEQLWKRYERMVEEYTDMGCTSISISSIPGWAIDKFITLGYTVVPQGTQTLVKWEKTEEK